MKKVIYSSLITLLLVGGAMAQATSKNVGPVFDLLQVAGNPDAVVTVNAPTTSVEIGSSFTIPVTVSDTTGRGIIAYQFDLHYDPTVIQPQANPVEVAGTISSGLIPVFNPITPGVLKVAVYGAYPLTGAGTLLNFKFTAVGPAAGVSSLTWVNLMFNEGTPAANAANGQIRLVSSSSGPAPTSFSGQETMAGAKDILNNIYRDNTFVMVSGDPIHPNLLTVSFDLAPVEGESGSYNIVSGHWSLAVFRKGNYFGSLYGEVSQGRISDTLDNSTGESLLRAVQAHFSIKGGTGRFENITLQEMNNVEFTLRADYRNGRKATALLYLF